MLGFGAEQHGYILYDCIEKKEVVSRNVHFRESSFSHAKSIRSSDWDIVDIDAIYGIGPPTMVERSLNDVPDDIPDDILDDILSQT